MKSIRNDLHSTSASAIFAYICWNKYAIGCTRKEHGTARTRCEITELKHWMWQTHEIKTPNKQRANCKQSSNADVSEWRAVECVPRHIWLHVKSSNSVHFNLFGDSSANWNWWALFDGPWIIAPGSLEQRQSLMFVCVVFFALGRLSRVAERCA